MSIVNLTQHPATAEQVAAGVFDLAPGIKTELQELLTFCCLPGEQEIRDRAEQIAAMAAAFASPDDRHAVGAVADNDRGAFALQAMIGGALWLMAPLAVALREQGIEPVFAFSVRETEEQKQPDGSVRKIAVFRHAGFVPSVI